MTVTRALVVGICCIGLLTATPADAGQTTSSVGPSATAGKRFVWTLIRGGLGLGGGLLSGLSLFNDAINGDRKVWTITALGAVGGGLMAICRVGRPAVQRLSTSGTRCGTAWRSVRPQVLLSACGTFPLVTATRA